MIPSRTQCLSEYHIHVLIYVHRKNEVDHNPSRKPYLKYPSLRAQIFLFDPVLSLQLLGLGKERNELCVLLSSALEEMVEDVCVLEGRKEWKIP